MKRILSLFIGIFLFILTPLYASDWRIESPWNKSGTNISPQVLTDTVGNFYKIDFIPIGWAIDGAVAPGILSTLTSTNSAKYRNFSGAADNDVFIEWQVPYGIDTTIGIVFQVEGWITNATAPADTETVKFALSGVSIGDSELLSLAQGAAITITKTFNATYVQYDQFISGYSGVVTIAGLSAGEVVIFSLKRDTTDTYAQSIGVGWLKVKYAIKLLGS